MGKIGNLAYNIGTSLNKEDIDNHRQAITPTAQTLQSLSTEEQLAYHAQNQALLNANQEQLEGEKDSGDGFESNRYIPPFINTNNPNARRWNVNNNPHALTVRRELVEIRKIYPSFGGIQQITNGPVTQREAAEYTAFRIFIRHGTNQTYANHNAAFDAFRASPYYQNLNRPNSTQLNIGLNNANYNVARHNAINARDIQQIRIQQIRHDFNAKSIQPKDMIIKINGNTYYANPTTSQGAPVYRGVSNRDIQDYYMQIAGVSQMPNPRPMGNNLDIYGRPAQVWTVTPIQGPLAGASINLRTFSSSQNKTQAKYTIEITGLQNTQSGINARKIEIKFEK